MCNNNFSTNPNHISVIKTLVTKIDSSLRSAPQNYAPPLDLSADTIQAIVEIEAIANILDHATFFYLVDEIFLLAVYGTIDHPGRNRPLLNIALRIGFQVKFKYTSKPRFIYQLNECYALERRQEYPLAHTADGYRNSDIIKEFLLHVEQNQIHPYNLFFLPSTQEHFAHRRWFPFMPELNRDINVDIFSPLDTTIKVDTVVFHIGGYNDFETYLARRSIIPQKYGDIYAEAVNTDGVKPFILVFVPCYYELTSMILFNASTYLFRDTLLPMVQKYFCQPLQDIKLIFSGYSAGALYALTSGVKLDKTASYVITSGAHLLMAVNVIQKTNNSIKQMEHIFVSCGKYDNLLSENQNFVKFIALNGVPHKFVEHNAGHSWGQIRESLAAGLIWTLQN